LSWKVLSPLPTALRLEYGSLWTSPDGPIEPGVSSYPLAVSAELPTAVEPFHRPWILGVGAELAPGAPHGTVLRCLRIEGKRVQGWPRPKQFPLQGFFVSSGAPPDLGRAGST